jgi:RNA polymerase sigma-70 factor (ECF subfamily)
MPDLSADRERVISLISSNYPELLRFAFTLLPHQHDAQDVLQEALLAITRKFSEYDPDRPFLPWASRFVYIHAIKSMERNASGPTYLSPELMEVLARERQEEGPALAARSLALTQCLDRLRPEDRKVINGRYFTDTPLEELAPRLGMSRRTLFRRLDHIRWSLLECITRHTAIWGDL